MRRLAGTRKVGHGGPWTRWPPACSSSASAGPPACSGYLAGHDKDYDRQRATRCQHTDRRRRRRRAGARTQPPSPTTRSPRHSPPRSATWISPVVGVGGQGRRPTRLPAGAGRRGRRLAPRAGTSPASTSWGCADRPACDAGTVVDVDIEVGCSSGTYVRALARDVGAALGVGGHLTALRRTRIGAFSVTGRTRSTNCPPSSHRPVAEAARAGFQALDLDAERSADVRVGRPSRWTSCRNPPCSARRSRSPSSIRWASSWPCTRSAPTACARPRCSWADTPAVGAGGRRLERGRPRAVRGLPGDHGCGRPRCRRTGASRRRHRQLRRRAPGPPAPVVRSRGRRDTTASWSRSPSSRTRWPCCGPTSPRVGSPRPPASRNSSPRRASTARWSCRSPTTPPPGRPRCSSSGCCGRCIPQRSSSARASASATARAGTRPRWRLPGFDVREVDLTGVVVHGHQAPVSSSSIRYALDAGDVESAAAMLGRPHRVDGTVIRGDQRGRALLGFPTANLPVDPAEATPADGVYAGWLTRLDPLTEGRQPAGDQCGLEPDLRRGPATGGVVRARPRRPRCSTACRWRWSSPSASAGR